MKKQPVNSRRGCLTSLILAGIPLLVIVFVITILTLSPALAAQGSDILRSLLGDKMVAQIESAIFQVQDGIEQWRYGAAGVTPPAPWPTSNSGASEFSVVPTRSIPTWTAVPGATEGVSPLQPTATEAPAATPAWMPAQVPLLGSLQGEGIWSTYIQDTSGQAAAYRTYLQPDLSHPYAIVGVVAFDTSRTNLHFVLGSNEPYSPDGPRRTGQMPAADKLPGVLIAMFNGGFKARHGHFGAMADGKVALPPRDGLGTIVMYADGRLRLGAWGQEITVSPDMRAWRQNGPLVVRDGQINPDIYNNSPADWGYTVKDVSPTWRSGIGLSADGRTLYYLCGSSLSMEMLAKSMLAAGVTNGIQLDINNYWVHFVAVRNDNNSLRLEPLFPDMMFEHIDRYLYAYTRDYFYVTLAK